MQTLHTVVLEAAANVPGLHAVHTSALVVFENEPAGHEEHTLGEVVQGVDIYAPGLHVVVHVKHLVAPA